jgi:thiopurine S-methyltransferase
MDNNYWLNRWKQNQTGWHQKEVEPALINFFSKLNQLRVFVPLCGKSLDLIWLANQGHEVVGVELSALGCETFFAENRIPVKKTIQDDFTLYQGSHITILNGDFFNLTPNHIGSFNAVYDRAALIALPPPIRPLYADHLLKLIRSCSQKSKFEFLQITLERIPSDTSGPPFSINSQEIQQLYGKELNISTLSREKVDMGDLGQTQTEESVYRLYYAR